MRDVLTRARVFVERGVFAALASARSILLEPVFLRSLGLSRTIVAPCQAPCSFVRPFLVFSVSFFRRRCLYLARNQPTTQRHTSAKLESCPSRHRRNGARRTRGLSNFNRNEAFFTLFFFSSYLYPNTDRRHSYFALMMRPPPSPPDTFSSTSFRPPWTGLTRTNNGDFFCLPVLRLVSQIILSHYFFIFFISFPFVLTRHNRIQNDFFFLFYHDKQCNRLNKNIFFLLTHLIILSKLLFILWSNKN